eukprot:13890_1
MAQQEEKKVDVAPKTSKDTLKLLDLVETAFKNGGKLDSMPNGICGRIQKYTDDKTPTQLSKSYKLFSWIVGADGLYQMCLLPSNVSKLNFIGITSDYIQSSMTKNNIKFRLTLFSADNNDAYAATWDNVFILFKRYVNEAYIRMEKHIEALKNTSFEDIEKQAGFCFLDVHILGEEKSDKFMTLERFNKIDVDKVTLVDCRLFLYNWLGLKELYIGDGYTKDENGEKGCLEYLMPNKFLKDIPDLRIVALDVDVSEIK